MQPAVVEAPSVALAGQQRVEHLLLLVREVAADRQVEVQEAPLEGIEHAGRVVPGGIAGDDDLGPVVCPEQRVGEIPQGLLGGVQARRALGGLRRSQLGPCEQHVSRTEAQVHHGHVVGGHGAQLGQHLVQAVGVRRVGRNGAVELAVVVAPVGDASRIEELRRVGHTGSVLVEPRPGRRTAEAVVVDGLDGPTDVGQELRGVPGLVPGGIGRPLDRNSRVVRESRHGLCRSRRRAAHRPAVTHHEQVHAIG